MGSHRKFIIPIALAFSVCLLTVYSYSGTWHRTQPIQNTATGSLSVEQHRLQFTTPEKTKVLGEHSTTFKGGNKGRISNIKHAASKINGAIINPGEVFSFNETVGPTTKKNGFKLARIFVRGKDSEGYGGGVCQVSSTLFNAVDKAGLNVIERHNHSKPVSYVASGMDAATSYGVIDFKFENNTPTPIRIDSTTNEEALVVKLELAQDSLNNNMH